MLAYEDARAAIDWLCTAFGFVEDPSVRHTDANGVIGHAEIARDGARVMLATPNADYRSPRHHRETCGDAARWLDNSWVIDGVFVEVDDVADGSFTITNPGGYGTFHGTPVISQPQAGILGTYAIVKRPWVITDENGADAIAIRSMMNLTLTYDHRLVDGAYAGRFLRDLRERLQSWSETDY